MKMRSAVAVLLLEAAQACLLPHERDPTLPGGYLHRRQSDSDLDSYATEEYFEYVANYSLPVAANTTDRFEGGEVAPRGLGSQDPDTTFTEALNVIEIRSAIEALAKEFPEVQLFELPEKTHDGNTMFGAKVGNQTCDDAYRIFLMTGIHARERGGPDNLIYFIADLLWARREGTGLVYGNREYDNDDVNTALSTGIVFLPLVNPDGVAFDQQTNLCWRKNRNPDGPVDLNRNFDFLWNFTQHFAPGVDPASTDPDSEIFYGTAPFSEPETKNVKWVYDNHKLINWFMDIHSFADLVMHPWGDDTNQDDDPRQNFTNPAYDGKRGVINDTEEYQYESYIETTDWSRAENTARRVALAMTDGNGGRDVAFGQGASLYPTSGASDDYAYSRGLADRSLTLVRGFGVEFGVGNELMGEISCPFYPNETFFNMNIRSMGSGIMEFLLAAVEEGVGEPVTCEEGENGSGTGGNGTGDGTTEPSGVPTDGAVRGAASVWTVVCLCVVVALMM